jgi:DNA topoisomerase-2
MSKSEIMSFSENHTTTKVSFDIKMNISKLQRYLHGDIHNKFKLRNTLSTRNMHAFTPDMKIARYTTPQEIADAFFPIRLNLYGNRKILLECNMEYTARMMRNKARFVEAVSTDEINLLRGRKSKDATIAQLEQMGFATHSELNAIKTKHSAGPNVSDGNELTTVDEDSSNNDSTKEFDYLLNMPLSSLTMEKLIHSMKRHNKRSQALRDKVLVQGRLVECRFS